MEKETTTCCACDDDHLPFLLVDDYLIPILVRLPIVSLLQFKSVCKSWCTLIQSSFFTHLHHTFNSSSSSSFILQASVDKYSVDKYALTTGGLELKVETEILILSSESESESGFGGWCWSSDDNQQLFKVYGYNGYGKVMVGSCNGLICLYDEQHMEVTLWNPATRQFRILPKPITIENQRYREGDNFFVGFGFDIKTKDYKVVLLQSFLPLRDDGTSQGCHVQVYSLSTDSWRLLEGINSLPGLPMLGVHGLYLNGSCFFMANYCFFRSRYNGWFMISFDFTKEIITTMEFPDHDHTKQRLFLTYLGGDKMALFTVGQDSPHNYEKYDYRYRYEDYDIWVLNEHGRGGGVNKESWTKLHSLQIKRSIAEHTIPKGISNDGEFVLLESKSNVRVHPTIPKGISNNGEFALLESNVGSPYGFNKMELYNLVTKESKKDFLSYDKKMSRANVYKPSMVSIISGNGAAAAADRVIAGGAM